MRIVNQTEVSCEQRKSPGGTYIILSGSGRIIDGSGKRHAIQAGDHILVPPGEAHQIVNDSPDDLEYLVIADHHPADVVTYPNTGKRMLKPENRCVVPTDADYYEGEE